MPRREQMHRKKGVSSSRLGLGIAAILFLWTPSASAKNPDVSPDVNITSPADGTVTNGNTLDVEVSFSGNDPGQGNVQTVILRANGTEVGRFANPPENKSGATRFTVNLSSFGDGTVTLQAEAYQGAVQARLVGKSNVVNLLIDRTPPALTHTLTPAPNVNGWNRSSVTVHFVATDSGSGIASVTPDIVISTEGAGQIVTGTAVDKAGNTASTTATLNLDKTLPELAITFPPEGATIGAQPTLSAAYADFLSGIDLAAVSLTLDGIPTDAAVMASEIEFTPLALLSAGSHSFTVVTTDRAGNSRQASRSFFVQSAITGTRVEGAVKSTEGVALAGVTLSIGTISTSSAADGAFTLVGIPSGDQKIHVDATTATTPGGPYASVNFLVRVLADQITFLNQPIFLPKVDLSGAQPITSSMVDANGALKEDLVIANPNLPGVVLTLEAGTVVTYPGGAHTGPEISISMVPSDKLPHSLPEEFGPAFVISIQPEGAVLSQPAPITFPNTDSFASGNKVELYSLNPETGQFEEIGLGTVNGGSIDSDPGVGITRFDWHFAIPPPPEVPPSLAGGVSVDGRGDLTSAVSRKCEGSVLNTHNGELSEDIILPAYRSVGVRRAVRLHYSSLAASPQPVLGMDPMIPAIIAVPQSVSRLAKVDGVQQGLEAFTDTSGFNEAVNETFHQKYRVQGQELTSGLHQVQLNLSSQYGASRRTAILIDSLGINNLRASPYGSGWSIAGLQRLYTDESSNAFITDGDGNDLIYRFLGMGGGTCACVNNRLYVANQGSGSVSVIDTTSNTVIHTIQVAATDVQALAVNSDGSRLYVVHSATSTLFVFDTTTFESIGSVVFDGRGHEVMVSPDGSRVYLVTDRGQLNVIDTATLQVLKTVTLPGGTAFAAVMTPDGSRVYVGDQFEDLLSVFDTATEQVIATIQAGGNRQLDMAVSPDGSRVYTVNQNNSTLSVIDTASNQVLATVSSGGSQPVGVEVSPDGRRLYVSNGGSNELVVMDSESFEVMARIPIVGPFKSVISENGARLYVTSSSSGTVSVVDTVNNAVIATIGVGVSPVWIAGIVSGGGYGSPPGEFSMLEPGPGGTFIRRYKDGREVIFNTDGLQISDKDRNGNEILFAYHGEDHLGTGDNPDQTLASITDPVGLMTILGYTNGKLASITDPSGRTTFFTVDGNGNLAAIQNPDGTTREFGYDGDHLLVNQTNERRFVTSYQYDMGLIQGVSRPDGSGVGVMAVQRVGLEANGTASSPSAVIRPEEVAASFADANGHLEQVRTDPRGAALKVTDPLGHETVTERGDDSLPTRVVNARRAVSSFVWSDMGDLLSATQEDIAATVSIEYEPVFHQPTRIVDAEGRETLIRYDTNGNPVEIENALHEITRIAYNTRGLPTTITDALNHSITIEYNKKLLPFRVTDALGRKTEREFDPAGNVIAVIDALLRRTISTYGVMNRRLTVTDANGGITRSEYDLRGNQTALVDAKLQRTEWVFDTLDRVESVKNPVGDVERYERDPEGNITARVTRNEVRITQEFNARNELVKKTVPGVGDFLFEYNEVGQLLQARIFTTFDVAVSVISNVFDLAGRLTSTSTAGSANQPATTITYQLDKVGNRKRMDDPSGTTTYEVDALDRVTGLINSANLAWAWDFDAAGRQTSQTNPNNTSVSLGFDEADQLLQIQHLTGASLLAQFDYQLNVVGDRTQQTEQIGLGLRTRDMGYDVLDRLTGVTSTDGANEGFSFDAVGNQLQVGQQHDAANRILEDANFTYKHDKNGNLIEKRSKTDPNDMTFLDWDAEDRLVKVTTPAHVVEFKYDALNRRIEKKVTEVATSVVTTTRFIYNGVDILLEADGNNQLWVKYTHAAGIDRPLAREELDSSLNTVAVQVYHQDGNNNIVALSDFSGNLIESYEYSAFGKLSLFDASHTPTTAPPLQSFTFTGREFDPETGLYFYRARYYDPVTGSFIGEDPVGFFGGDANLYAYVFNNPVNWIDPFGLDDYALGADIDLVFGLGTEFSFGFVLDTDSLQESGIYWNAGDNAAIPFAGGLNFGLGGALTYSPNDIEGKATNCDLNVGALGAAVGITEILPGQYDTTVFSLSYGPGAGASISRTETKTLTIGAVFSSLKTLTGKAIERTAGVLRGIR